MAGIQGSSKVVTSLPEFLTHVLMVIQELQIIVKIMVMITGGIFAACQPLQRHYLLECSHQSSPQHPHIRNEKTGLGEVN